MTVPDSANPMLDAALAFHAAGCSVVPAMGNGTKRPLGTWQKYQRERADHDQLHVWFGNAHPGIGLVCGQVSGGLIMLEAEGRAVGENLLARAREHALAAGIGELWRTVMAGYLEQTPAGGVHILYRIDGPAPGNQKLARRPNAAGGVDVLAETRGEGGFTITAPSHGPTHPTGRPWLLLQGGPATIPTLTLAEHTALCSVFRTLDEMPTEEDRWQSATPTSAPTGSTTTGSPTGSETTTPAPGAKPPPPGLSSSSSLDLSPGSDFNACATWPDILTPHGWRIVGQRGQVADWRRPGKTDGISATTGYGGDRGDFLYVFTTSTTLDSERAYSKFAAWAALNHAGDFSAAARELRRLGYGGQNGTTHGSVFDLLPPQPAPEPAWTTSDSPTTLSTGSSPESTSTALTPTIAGATSAESSSKTAEGSSPQPDLEQLAAQRRVQLEQHYYDELVARDAARKRYDAEIFARDFRPPTARTLSDELALPDEPVRYRVDRVMPEESNVLLTASYKVGKTTTVGNLTKALVDGGLFLGKFPVARLDEGRRVAIFNYELSETQYRRWLRDLAVENTDGAAVFHLRGITLPLTQQWAEDFVVTQLLEMRAQVWIVDPFARAFVGSGEENSNTDVGAFVHLLDRIKERAAISELVMPTHTGRGEAATERARGATRINDWADVQWLMSKDEEGLRYFSASGRDVEVEEEKLTYDETVRSLQMGGGDRKWQARRGLVERVIEVVTENPGIKTTDLFSIVGGKKAYFEAARDEALHNYRIKIVKDGTASLYHPTNRIFGGA